MTEQKKKTPLQLSCLSRYWSSAQLSRLPVPNARDLLIRDTFVLSTPDSCKVCGCSRVEYPEQARVCSRRGGILPKATSLCKYLGSHMTTAAFKANPSAYAVQLYRGVLDARRTSDGFGRYANAANTARQANAQLISERKLIGRRGSGRRVFPQATKAIEDGEEILVKYGSGYWRGNGSAGNAHPL